MFGFITTRTTLLLEGRRCAEKYVTGLLKQVRSMGRPMQQVTMSYPLGILLENEFQPEDMKHNGWAKSVFLHGFVAACEDELKHRKVEGVRMKIRPGHWQLMNGPDHVPQPLMRVEVTVESWKIDRLQPVANMNNVLPMKR